MKLTYFSHYSPHEDIETHSAIIGAIRHARAWNLPVGTKIFVTGATYSPLMFQVDVIDAEVCSVSKCLEAVAA